MFVTAENAGDVLDVFWPDYVADAIDTVSYANSRWIVRASKKSAGSRVQLTWERATSSTRQGSGLQTSPKSSSCPLAKVVMRRELRARGITGVEALWSDEEPRKPQGLEHENHTAGMCLRPFRMCRRLRD